MTATVNLDGLELPGEVKRVLGDFLEAAQKAFGPELYSAVLYGSAAEGKLRATSDVNLVLVLNSFARDKADLLREPLRFAQAAVQLRPMFLLRGEMEAASQAFAQKFADILRRRRVLYGSDPFAGTSLPRETRILELKQQVLNLVLRMRALYVARSPREEQLALVMADFAGPLRSCAAALLELEGRPADTPKQALQQVAAPTEPGMPEALAFLSQARETRAVPPGTAARSLFSLLELAQRMHTRAGKLS
jgi:predicted nucleotidyltransferase